MSRSLVETSERPPQDTGRQAPATPRTRRRDGPEQSLFVLILGCSLLLLSTAIFPLEDQWLRLRKLGLEATGVGLAFWTLARRPWDLWQARTVLLAPPNLAALCFLVWAILSAATSDLPQVSRYEVLRHVGGVLLYFAVALGLSSRSVGKLVGFLGAAAAAGGVQALILSRRHSNGWVAGAFMDPQLLSGYLCLMLPFLVVIALKGSTILQRLLGAAGLVTALAVLLVTYNRSAWAGCVVAMGVMGLLYRRCRTARHRRPGGSAGFVAAAAGLTAAAGLFLALSQTAGLSLSRAASLTELGRDHGFQHRLRLWQAARWMADERPLLGWGPGTFAIHQSLYVVDSREQSEILEGGASLSENAHNTYLQLAAEVGYPGAILYLSILAGFLGMTVRALERVRGRFRRYTLLAAAAGVAGQSVTAIGSPAWEFGACSTFLWVVLGTGVAIAACGWRPGPVLAALPVDPGREPGSLKGWSEHDGSE